MKPFVASEIESAPQTALITSLQQFCRAADISPITAWRFRKRGWLQTINICGRQYVTAEATAEFLRRAAAGEFSKVHKTPQSTTKGNGE